MTLLFVAGAHTDVGKTFVACELLRVSRLTGREVDAFKPVLSGFDPDHSETSDAGRLLGAMGRPCDAAALDRVSPLRFATPIAPPLAARRHGVRLTRDSLARMCNGWLRANRGELALVEGAGGVMSPIADDATNLDLIDDLGLPVLLVGGSYLGAISHTLTALEALRGRNLPVIALVISQDEDPEAPDFAESIALTQQFTGSLPIFAAGRDGDRTWVEDLLRILPMSPPPRRRQVSPGGV